MSQYTTRPLGTATWAAFDRLLDKHDVAVGWAQFGTPAELPNIHHKKDYEAGLESWPDYRITCIFVDRNHRREGVAAVALGGALDLIAAAGGGVVEGYPQDTAGKKISSSRSG